MGKTKSEAVREALARPDVRKRMLDGQKAAMARPGFADEQEARRSLGNSPAARQKANATLSAACSSVEGRERMRATSAVSHTVEVKAARSAGNRAAWADPDKRSARCAKIKAAWEKRKERERCYFN